MVLGLYRQSDRDGGPLAYRTGHGDTTDVVLDVSASDVESQPAAFGPVSPIRKSDAKDLFLCLRGDADARILDFHDDPL